MSFKRYADIAVLAVLALMLWSATQAARAVPVFEDTGLVCRPL